MDRRKITDRILGMNRYQDEPDANTSDMTPPGISSHLGEAYPGADEARTPINKDGNLQVTNRPGFIRRQLLADRQEFTGRNAITAGVSQVTIDAAKHLDVDEPKNVKRTPPIRSQGESLSPRPLKDLPFMDMEVYDYVTSPKSLNPLLVHEQTRENIHPDRPQIDTMQIYREIEAARKKLPDYSLDVANKAGATNEQLVEAGKNIYKAFRQMGEWAAKALSKLALEIGLTNGECEVVKNVLAKLGSGREVISFGRTDKGHLFIVTQPKSKQAI